MVGGRTGNNLIHAGGFFWEQNDSMEELALPGLDPLRLEISPESVIDYGSLAFGGLQGEAYKFKTEGSGCAVLCRLFCTSQLSS